MQNEDAFKNLQVHHNGLASADLRRHVGGVMSSLNCFRLNEIWRLYLNV